MTPPPPATARRAELRRMGRFGLVGLLNTAVDIAVFALLHGVVGLALVPANLLAFAAALGNSFVWNRHWTFAAPTRAPGAAGVLAFVLVCTAGAGLATAALAAMVAAGVPVVLAKPASVAVSMVWNYAAMRRIVFAAGGER